MIRSSNHNGDEPNNTRALDHEPDQQDINSRSRWRRMRIAALAWVLIFEIAFVFILRIAGWNGATVTLAGIAAVLPIIVGLTLIFHRGRSFTIRSLLIATACFACFVVITLQPLLKAQQARQVTIALQKADIQLHRPYDLIDYLKLFDQNSEDISDLIEINNWNTSSEFPAWIYPIAGDLTKTPRDDSLVFITVSTDAELKLVCDSASELSNLKMLKMQDVSADGLRYLAKHVDDFEKLDSFFFVNCSLADDCLKNLTKCHLMMIQTGANTNPTHSQLSEIANLPKLEYLWLIWLNFPIVDSDLEQLSACQTLKKLHIYRGDITTSAIDDFKKSHPDCEMTINQ